MDSLVINGSMSSNSTEIKEHKVQFYNQLYSEQFTWRPKVNGLLFLSIDAKESNRLGRDFEEQEVREVVRDLNGDKALGPDSFTIAFFPEVL